MSEESTAERKGLWSQPWVYVMFAITASILLFYALKPVSEDDADWVTQIILIALAAAASVVFLLVANQFKWFNTKTGQITTLIAVGLILWVIAEILFPFQAVSFPTIADIFYIAGYIPFAVGLFLYIRTVKMKFKPLTFWIWVGISVALFVVVLIYEFIPFIEYGIIYPEESIWSWTVVYPAEDIVILVLVFVLVLKFRSGEIAKPWIILVIGFIFNAAGDIWFSYLSWYESELSAYDLYDLFFTLAYVAMLAAGIYFLWLYKKH
ncbi:MAG: hypothetical protein LUQ65_04525 [Candidatus Helarchaeota archaeon]|nr:hypothetical protein [Candidatus Helarchaeota archaeon]